MSDTADAVATLIESSVRRFAEGKEVAVAFSGGLDSGLVGAVSARFAESVRLYVAGVPGCHDIDAAKSAAAELGLELAVLEIEDPVGLIREEIALTGMENPLVLAFSSPLFAVLRGCREDIVLGGQGADEVFGGYNKYVSVSNDELKSRMKEDLERFWSESCPHEERMASAFGKTIGRPYLTEDVVSFMDSLPAAVIRPDKSDRKKVLCDVAEYMGFDFLAHRPKKAAQYGSGILDAIKDICHGSGIEYNQMVAEMVRELRE